VRRRTVVVSAVNFLEGGPLSVLHDCLAAASEHLADRYDVVALVHDARLLDVPRIRYLEFPASRRSWLVRLYYEYVHFRRLSLELEPHLWLSLHDITPNVVADRRAVYCHNPAPFFRLSARHAWLDPTFALFNLFYAQLYRIHIRENDVVVVQQEWLAREFRRRFGVDDVVVAHPLVPAAPVAPLPRASDGRCRLLFPTFPRVFKNVEVLGEAAALLESRGRQDVEFLVTIDGTENRYARYIRKRYGHLRGLRLIGRRTRPEVFGLYGEVQGLVFPSRLETWGMPLSEFQAFGKPILAADLPYAHETVGPYGKVKFFSSQDASSLADAAVGVARGDLVYDRASPAPPPRATDWHQLLLLLLGEERGGEPSC
jgi:glycosyltransferase involved in cell wall biosynthesis